MSNFATHYELSRYIVVVRGFVYGLFHCKHCGWRIAKAEAVGSDSPHEFLLWFVSDCDAFYRLVSYHLTGTVY